MVLFGQDDEWQDGRPHLLPESMARIDVGAAAEVVGPAPRMVSWTIRRTDDALLHHVLALTSGPAVFTYRVSLGRLRYALDTFERD